MPSFLSEQMLRRIDWSFLVLSLLLAWMGGGFSFSPEMTLRILAYYGIFFLLSFLIPVNRSRAEKRCYVGLHILIFTLAAMSSHNFTLLKYWFIAKSYFLLGRKEAIVSTILTGIGYLLGYFWGLPTLIALIVETGVERWLEPQQMMLSQLQFYVGASSFTLLFAIIIMAEQKSRHKAEALTQQVKTLAAALERTRIAREIHDSLGHSLTTLDVQLELAQRVYQQDPRQAGQSLNVAKQLTSQCLRDVRRSVQTLRGKTFDLNEAIATLAYAIDQQQTFVMHVTMNLPQLPPQMGHQLYCIIQEGLTNVQKHADATTVTLSGEQKADELMVILHDNGQGFKPCTRYDGFGIRGMHERSATNRWELYHPKFARSGDNLTGGDALPH